MNVAIVSPGHPTLRGGVSDHTTRLCQHWREAGCSITVLDSLVGRAEDVTAHWRTLDVRAVLIQYVPFLYGRRGLSPFPWRVARAAAAAEMRVIVFVHEPWVPRTRLPWLVLSPLQQRQLLTLLATCAGYATPVPGWIPWLGTGGKVIYVGSTLGDVLTIEPEPPLESPTVFAPFASGLNWDWIVAAARAIGARPALTVIGGDYQQARTHPALRRWANPTWDWRGYLDAASVLALLARSRLVLAPFEDGLTARRTSPCAALSTGTRVVASRGHLFDPVFDSGPITFGDSPEQFAQRARDAWNGRDTPDLRRQRLSWYRATLDPRTWDRRLLDLLLDRRHR